ncbi:MAG: GNAT family N-acetyltransferase [Candidatus Niameybacter stercoravium]|nr:GNAT family N-acetyltransferase [Candidatus Niameybacter stercoravium]
MNIRLFEEKDKDAYIKMATEMYSSEACIHGPNQKAFEGNFNGAIDENNIYCTGLIIEEEDKPIGYCLISQSWASEFGKRMNFIEEIYLVKESRGKGYVNQIFYWIFEHYKKEDCVFRLEVSPENKEVMNIYKKHKFQPLEYLQMVRL